MMQNKQIDRTDKIVLAGGGGHALSIMEAIQNPDIVAGYTALSESSLMHAKWLGDDSMVEELSKKGYLFHMAFVYAGLPIMNKRRNMIEKYSEAGAKFTSIIASSAIVTRHSEIGPGCAILNNAVVNRAKLGDNVIVNTGAIVEHDCTVGNNTFIGPGAVIGGGVTIGEDCFIGLGAKVMNGVTIASGVTVGIGVTVNRDLTEPGIYHGTPMRFHKLKNK